MFIYALPLLTIVKMKKKYNLDKVSTTKVNNEYLFQTQTHILSVK